MKKSFLIIFTLISIDSFAVKSLNIASDKAYNAVIGLPYCTGTFIHPQIIITAAHCLPNIERTLEINLKTRNDSIYVDLEFFKAHPKYTPNSGNLNYDVAVLKLKKPINLPEIISSIPKLDDTGIESGNGIIIGMGYDSEQINRFNHTYDDMKKRSAILERLSPSEETLLTAITSNQTEGACRADSGGALLVRNDNNDLIYVGDTVAILTTGKNCSNANNTIIFNRFFNVRDWVQEVTGINLFKI